MSTATELKLLTLLNVTAIKRPFEKDIPGGHRGSPALGGRFVQNGSESPAPRPTKAPGSAMKATKATPSPAAKGKTNGEAKQNGKRRKSVVFGGEVGPSGSTLSSKRKRAKVDVQVSAGGDEVMEEKIGSSSKGQKLEVEEESEDEGKGRAVEPDAFSVHFGLDPPQLKAEAITQATEGIWHTERRQLPGFGRVAELQPGRAPVLSDTPSSSTRTTITPSLLASLGDATVDDPLLSTALTQVGTYKDLYLHSLDGEADGSEKKLFGEQKEAMRKAAVVHALNHVLKTRRKIIRNNEKLAHAAAAGPNASSPDPPRDQSFTRPKVLLLLPLRSLALHYLTAHLLPLAPPGTQIENQRPFINSFSIPTNTTDPLASTEAVSQFPIDHLVNFRGNSDDNFRFGIKITRKAWRIVMMPANEAKMMDCDIIVASSLGMKMQAEKEGSTDLLSSLEVVVVDGVDVMMMQNWDHVQYLFQHMNEIPQSPHGCDFSRVKPWYLESQAKFVRQTIMLSRYDSPEARALFSQHCFNLAGKLRTEKTDYEGVMTRVREGVKQTFERVDMDLKGGEGPVEEVEKRLEFFTKKTIPALLRSAVSREYTLIIIPSYFDFVRVTHFLRKNQLISFAAISEYSSNSEISRARTLFFKGKKPFLLMTERFHFYRRYRIRGAKTIVWYQPPEHAQFYSETLETPFLPSRNGGGATTDDKAEGDEAEVDEGEVSARVLWSKYDKLRLERLVGGDNWRRMISSGEGKAEFL